MKNAWIQSRSIYLCELRRVLGYSSQNKRCGLLVKSLQWVDNENRLEQCQGGHYDKAIKFSLALQDNSECKYLCTFMMIDSDTYILIRQRVDQLRQNFISYDSLSKILAVIRQTTKRKCSSLLNARNLCRQRFDHQRQVESDFCIKIHLDSS